MQDLNCHLFFRAKDAKLQPQTMPILIMMLPRFFCLQSNSYYLDTSSDPLFPENMRVAVFPLSASDFFPRTLTFSFFPLSRALREKKLTRRANGEFVISFPLAVILRFLGLDSAHNSPVGPSVVFRSFGRSVADFPLILLERKLAAWRFVRRSSPRPLRKCIGSEVRSRF